MMTLAAILIKVTVVLAIALVGTHLARKSPAAVRHALLTAAFAVLLGLPIASVVAPTIRISVPIAVQEIAVPAPLQEIPFDASTVSYASAGVALQTPALPSPKFSVLALLLAGWMIMSIVFLLPIVAGLWQMRSLRRSGNPWPERQSVLEALAIEAGIHRRIEVHLHELVSGPMTCGVLRPTVLLPLDAPAWTEEDLRRALIHELEHVRRGDWVSQCFARVVCACYWFHPLVWIARRRHVLEAERACDDAVLRRADATAYAAQLVGLAERLSTTSTRPLLAMANHGDLTTRVRAVLDQRQRRGRAGMFCLAFICATAALFVSAVSSLRIVAAARGAVISQAQSASAQQPKLEVASIMPGPSAVPQQAPTRGNAAPQTPRTSPRDSAEAREAFEVVSVKPIQAPVAGGATTSSVVQGYRLGEIEVTGAKILAADLIRSLLKLDSGKVFNESRLRYDINTLREYYASLGYVRFAAEPVPDFDAQQKVVNLSVNIDEGSQYIVGEIKVTGVKILAADLIRSSLRLVSGDVYNESRLRQGFGELKTLYSNLGYVNFIPLPVQDFDEGQKVVNLTVNVDEGRQYTVNRISFTGNTATPDEVIRREILLKEGEVFNASLLTLSLSRLSQLGFFEEIRFEDARITTPSPLEPKVDVDLRVKEKAR